MKKKIIILGSTGSIGSETLKSIKNKEFIVELLTTNQNLNKILKQAILFKVPNVIVENEKKYHKYKNLFKKKKINLHLGIKNIKKLLKNKVDYCVNAITGIDGLSPTLDILPSTSNILIANKESIICGWHLIKKKICKYNVNFIPIDSEHFSIWKLIKNENTNEIQKIVLTASGGPFLNISKKSLSNVHPSVAIMHPNWKMGKKISVDSSTMMNKIFEYIEAKKIFEINKNKLSILIHPTSFVHAIVFFKGQLIKVLAHDTSMTIPISYALGIVNKHEDQNYIKNIKKLNNLKFILPSRKKFPLLSILQQIPDHDSYFETILITINDYLVDKYLNNQINYVSIRKNILNIIKKPYFSKFYKLKPKNIYDIKKMINDTENYLDKNMKYYEK